MKVVVTGASGQLGSDVVEKLKENGHNTVGLSRKNADITDYAAVKEILVREKPDALIHCAAWTDVDSAELEENKPQVRKINAGATENLAGICSGINCKMIYISTDYVFGSCGTEPIDADSKSFHALNYYGSTKLEGEFAVLNNLDKYFIVRTSWVFGLNGKNFVRTMLDLSEKYSSVKVINDQIGTPTYTRDLAGLLSCMIESDRYGCYNAANEGGFISWYDFAKEIFRQAGKNIEVVPVTAEEYGLSKAMRPYNSRFDKSKLPANGFAPLPHWKDALGRYLKELKDRTA